MDLETMEQLPPGTILRLGHTGRGVQLVKRALAGHGCGPAEWRDPARRLGETYDGVVAAAVRVFQRQHGLSPDGIAGPLTLAQLRLAPGPGSDLLAQLREAARCAAGDGPLRALAVARLALQLHIRETGGNNRGPLVEALQLSAGCGTGDPWCAAFCDVCVRLGFAAAGARLPLRVGAGCSDFVRRAAKQGRVFELAQAGTGEFSTGIPAPGDLLVLRRARRTQRATPYRHIGLVAQAPDPRGIISTIEGNTNDVGSADGDGVYAKQRDPRRVLCVFVTLR